MFWRKFFTKSQDLEKNLELVVTNSKLRDIIKELESKKTFPIGVNLSDPSPVDVEARKMYVAEVAGLHKSILEPKLLQMISNCHKLLAEETNSREQDLLIKGTVYALWEIIHWGNAMVNEQVAYQTENNQ